MEHLSLLEKIKTALILTFTFFSFFLLFICPIELYAVYRVRNEWKPIKAELLRAEIKMVRHFANVHKVAQLEFRDLETGHVSTIHDLRPGDIPFEVLLFNSSVATTEQSDVERYAPLKKITVYRAPNGSDYFLEAGTYRFMAIVWGISISWWTYILSRAYMLRKYRKKIIENIRNREN